MEEDTDTEGLNVQLKEMTDLRNELVDMKTQFTSIIRDTIREHFKHNRINKVKLEPTDEAEGDQNTPSFPLSSLLETITNKSIQVSQSIVEKDSSFPRRSNRLNTTSDSTAATVVRKEKVKKNKTDEVNNPQDSTMVQPPIVRKKKRKLKSFVNGVRRHPRTIRKLNYKCNTCSESFVTFKLIQEHGQEKHGVNILKESTTLYHRFVVSKDPPLPCNLCGRVYANERSLKGHMKLHEYCCNVCGEKFTNNNTLEEHFSLVHPNVSSGENSVVTSASKTRGYVSKKKFKCTFENCFKSCASEERLNKHIKIHTLGLRFKCIYCEAKYVQKSDLNGHYRKSHGLAIETSVKFVKPIPADCTICYEHFESQRSLTNHVLKEHPEVKYFKCNLCDKAFETAHKLLSHKKRCHAPKTFVCEVCGKAFCAKWELDMHSPSHLERKDKPWKCSICSKGFSKKILLTYHERAHRGEKPVKCNLCDKTFSEPSAMYLHKKTHSGVKDFKCTLCDKSFYLGTLLKQHMKKHEGLLSCDICGKVSGSGADLKKHMLIHTGEKPHMCEICGIGYTQGPTLRKHRKQKHGLDNIDNRNRIFIPGLPPLPKLTKVIENQIGPVTPIPTPPNFKQSIQTTDSVMNVVNNVLPTTQDSNISHQDKNLTKSADKNSMEQDADNFGDFDNFDDTFSPCAEMENDFLSHEDETEQNEFLQSTTFDRLRTNNKEPATTATHCTTVNTEIIATPERQRGWNAISISEIKEETPNISCKEEFNTTDLKQQIPTRELVIRLERLSDYPCVVCKLTFWTQEKLSKHFNSRKHRINRKTADPVDVNVPVKRKKFSSAIARIKLRGKPYKCNVYCNESFDDWNEFLQHYKVHKHGKNHVEGEKTFQCRFCEENFTRNEALIKHEKTHPEARFYCKICSKSFMASYNLESHMKRHRDERPYQCDKCEKAYAEKNHLRRHKITFHAEGPVVKVCECGKEFRAKADYNKHYKRTHGRVREIDPDEPPVETILLPSGLVVAKPVHKPKYTGEKPWVCEICGMNFKTEGIMKSHVRLVHIATPIHTCEFCGKSFKRRRAMVRHVRLHTDERPFTCPHCPAAYANKEALFRHLKHHGSNNGNEVCSVCNGRFVTTSKLRTHERLVHPNDASLAGNISKMKGRNGKLRAKQLRAMRESAAVSTSNSSTSAVVPNEEILGNLDLQYAQPPQLNEQIFNQSLLSFHNSSFT